MRSDWPKLSTAFDTEPTRSMEPEQRSVQSQTASTILDLEICIDSILIFKACDPFPKKSLGFAALAFECLYLLRNGNSRNLTFRSTFFVGSPSHIAWRMSYLGLLNALMALVSGSSRATAKVCVLSRRRPVSLGRCQHERPVSLVRNERR